MRPLDVLLIESHRRVADHAAGELRSAGYRVHRCYAPDDQGFPCQAIRPSGRCPIDQGVDVALVVRSGVVPRPTPLEVGVSCAIRAGIPVAEQGTTTLDPFAPWLTHRIDHDVVQGVAVAASRGFDELYADVTAVTTNMLPVDHPDRATDCVFERDGHRLVVHLYGPPVDARTEGAMAVRVLDAVWRSGRSYGTVDVSYHPNRLTEAG
jgi:hypothetical protein